MQNLSSTILSQSTAVRTGVLPSVRTVCEKVTLDCDSVKPYKTNIKDWLLPIIDLRDYYVYPTNGITEGLNWWYYQENRKVDIYDGDYQWLTKTGTDILYLSMPSAIDGNMHNIIDNRPVALDLAYVGSTKIQPIEIKNVERAFYSLSKPFGIRNVRTGWYFTKIEDPRLRDLTISSKYYNYNAHAIAEKIIEEFSLDYVYNTLEYQQKSVCEKLNLNPSDSVWLSTTTHSEYCKFRRKGNIARLCLSQVYNYDI
jgi:hypothetical protein